MATSTELLTAIAPEVAARADAAVFLSLAAGQLDAAAWGANYALGAVYLAAHMATLAPATAAASAAAAGVAGPITAEAIGEHSRSYGSAASGVSRLTVGDASLMTTVYGREFVRLRATRAAGTARAVLV